MKFLKIAVIILLFALLVWVDLPEKFHPPFKTQLGLDLKGGSHLVFEADVSKVASGDLEDALNSSKDIIEKRVNFFGVSEPTVQTIRSNRNIRIVVDLPGVTNTADAVRLIGQTARLQFTEEATGSAQIATDSPQITKLTKETNLTGKDVKKATFTFNKNTGEPAVSLTFSPDGAKKFGDITTRNVGKQVGIAIDNFLISAPVVQQPITDGNAIITGNFTTDSARRLAIAINSGALPLPIKLVEQRSIGASLGESEVKKSVIAGVLGLFLVMFFMVLYYKKLGLIACLALIIYGMISFAIFRMIPIVLTLPGVAGFLLSIGMAVDSNILIFERIKEEVRKGRDFHIAKRLGFGRAIDAIKDANITTILVGLILFNPLNWNFLPQSGLVRGFAVTLLIGVCTSLFTGLVITKRLIDIFYRSK